MARGDTSAATPIPNAGRRSKAAIMWAFSNASRLTETEFRQTSSSLSTTDRWCDKPEPPSRLGDAQDWRGERCFRDIPDSPSELSRVRLSPSVLLMSPPNMFVVKTQNDLFTVTSVLWRKLNNENCEA